VLGGRQIADEPDCTTETSADPALCPPRRREESDWKGNTEDIADIRMPKEAKGCQRKPREAKGCQRKPRDARGSQRKPRKPRKAKETEKHMFFRWASRYDLSLARGAVNPGTLRN